MVAIDAVGTAMTQAATRAAPTKGTKANQGQAIAATIAPTAAPSPIMIFLAVVSVKGV